jgi:hypothetical protein
LGRSPVSHPERGKDSPKTPAAAPDHRLPECGTGQGRTTPFRPGGLTLLMLEPSDANVQVCVQVCVQVAIALLDRPVSATATSLAASAASARPLAIVVDTAKPVDEERLADVAFAVGALIVRVGPGAPPMPPTSGYAERSKRPCGCVTRACRPLCVTDASAGRRVRGAGRHGHGGRSATSLHLHVVAAAHVENLGLVKYLLARRASSSGFSPVTRPTSAVGPRTVGSRSSRARSGRRLVGSRCRPESGPGT